nr:MAG TPA: hypothetical protein [Caudoviricetes sp.]
MTTDLKLSSTHDLLLKDGKLLLTEGASQRAQQIKIALLTFLGEWEFDTSIGIPYLEQILVKTPNKFRVEAILRKKILAVQGVRRITAFGLDINRINRSLSVHFAAETDEGKVEDNVMIDGRNNV